MDEEQEVTLWMRTRGLISLLVQAARAATATILAAAVKRLAPWISDAGAARLAGMGMAARRAGEELMRDGRVSEDTRSLLPRVADAGRGSLAYTITVQFDDQTTTMPTYVNVNVPGAWQMTIDQLEAAIRDELERTFARSPLLGSVPERFDFVILGAWIG